MGRRCVERQVLASALDAARQLPCRTPEEDSLEHILACFDHWQVMIANNCLGFMRYRDWPCPSHIASSCCDSACLPAVIKRLPLHETHKPNDLEGRCQDKQHRSKLLSGHTSQAGTGPTNNRVYQSVIDS